VELAQMKTLAVLSRKGGAGKTTVTAHLGALADAAGLKVLLIDADPQRSLTGWWRTRPGTSPVLVEGGAADLATIVRTAKGEGFDLCIIDTMPSIEGDAVKAAQVANMALIVVRPSILDLRAAAGTVEALRRTDTRGAFLLNGAPSTRGTFETAIVREAIEALGGYGLPILSTILRTRQTYAAALIDGRSAHELEPKGRAAAEVKALWREIGGKKWLGVEN
jgi:chromosome partitioning protein